MTQLLEVDAFDAQGIMFSLRIFEGQSLRVGRALHCHIYEPSVWLARVATFEDGAFIVDPDKADSITAHDAVPFREGSARMLEPTVLRLNEEVMVRLGSARLRLRVRELDVPARTWLPKLVVGLATIAAASAALIGLSS